MKCLIINGSPSKSYTWNGPEKTGFTSKLTEQVVNAMALMFDIEFAEVRLIDVNIPYCQGCNQCFDQGEDACPHKQYVKPITDRIKEADCIIMTSPVYALNVSGLLKNFIDHTSFYDHRPAFFNKKALVITSAEGWGAKENSKYMADTLCHWGFNKVYRIHVTRGKSNQLDTKTVEKCHKIADSLMTDLTTDQVYSPSFAQIAFYNYFRLYCSGDFASESDRRYWEENGMLKVMYAPGIPLSFVKRVYGKIASFFVRKIKDDIIETSDSSEGKKEPEVLMSDEDMIAEAQEKRRKSREKKKKGGKASKKKNARVKSFDHPLFAAAQAERGHAGEEVAESEEEGAPGLDPVREPDSKESNETAPDVAGGSVVDGADESGIGTARKPGVDEARETEHEEAVELVAGEAKEMDNIANSTDLEIPEDAGEPIIDRIQEDDFNTKRKSKPDSKTVRETVAEPNFDKAHKPDHNIKPSAAFEPAFDAKPEYAPGNDEEFESDETLIPQSRASSTRRNKVAAPEIPENIPAPETITDTALERPSQTSQTSRAMSRAPRSSVKTKPPVKQSAPAKPRPPVQQPPPTSDRAAPVGTKPPMRPQVPISGQPLSDGTRPSVRTQQPLNGRPAPTGTMPPTRTQQPLGSRPVSAETRRPPGARPPIMQPEPAAPAGYSASSPYAKPSPLINPTARERAGESPAADFIAHNTGANTGAASPFYIEDESIAAFFARDKSDLMADPFTGISGSDREDE